MCSTCIMYMYCIFVGVNFCRIAPSSFRRYFCGFNFRALDWSQLERAAHLLAACDHAHGFNFHRNQPTNLSVKTTKFAPRKNCPLYGIFTKKWCVYTSCTIIKFYVPWSFLSQRATMADMEPGQPPASSSNNMESGPPSTRISNMEPGQPPVSRHEFRQMETEGPHRKCDICHKRVRP